MSFFVSSESLKTHSMLFHAGAIDSSSSQSSGYFKLSGERGRYGVGVTVKSSKSFYMKFLYEVFI